MAGSPDSSGVSAPGPDWERLTREWVRDGVISDDQRGPLLERLEAVPYSHGGSGVFGEAVIMGLVMIGVLLVTSSFVVALALIDVPEEIAAGVVVVLGLMQAAVGGPGASCCTVRSGTARARRASSCTAAGCSGSGSRWAAWSWCASERRSSGSRLRACWP
ncbi:MAG: hypothetical protein R3F61_07360 [Myxococcota bacterium]